MSVSKVIRLLRESPERIPEEERSEMRRLLELDAVGVVDIQGRSLEQARTENRRYRRDLGRILNVGRENERLLDFLHAFALSAMRAESTDVLARGVHRNAGKFGIADGYAMRMEDRVGELARRTRLWSRLGRELCVVGTRVPMEFKPCVGRNAARVRSHVMVRIGKTWPTSALGVFYSYAPQAFEEQGALDFMGRFAELAKARLNLICGGRKDPRKNDRD